jgi:hypothetical protein
VAQKTKNVALEKFLKQTALLCGLTIDSIVQDFFFPEALTRKSKTIAYLGHLL